MFFENYTVNFFCERNINKNENLNTFFGFIMNVFKALFIV